MATGMIMCKCWCERRRWCSEVMYDPNSLQCSDKKEMRVFPGLTVISVQRHVCEKCPQHHVCLHTRSRATKCVKLDTAESRKKGHITPGQTTGTCKSCKKRISRGHRSNGKKCAGNKRYVELVMPKFADNAEYFDMYAKCIEKKFFNLFPRKIKPHRVMGLEERTIYYWVMTLYVSTSWLLQESLSFQHAVTSLNRETPYHLKNATVFTGFTITVGKRITFISFKGSTNKSKPIGSRTDQYIVVLDRTDGRMLFGSKKDCFAVQDGIDVSDTLYPVVVHPPGYLPAPGNKVWFSSLGKTKRIVGDRAVETLMRRCKTSFQV